MDSKTVTGSIVAGVLGLAVLVGAFLLLRQPPAPQPTAPPSISAPPQVSQASNRGAVRLIVFEGSGSKKSRPFEVTGSDQMLIWRVSVADEPAFLTINVGDEVISPNLDNDSNGSSAMYLKPGKHHLDVSSLSKWRIEVYEERAVPEGYKPPEPWVD